MSTARNAISVVALALAACHSQAGSPDGGSLGARIVAPPGTWTWADFPDSTCDDGSPTGIGVNPSAGSSTKLFLYLSGGGACWDTLTCTQLHSATAGPFGSTQFQTAVASFTGTILDRSLSGNPVADWNLVFVPYCTGDMHGGDNVAAYGSVSYRHKGHANIVAYLKRLAATFTALSAVVSGGSSSGAFGALLNHDAFRAAWPNVAGAIVDDSGPPLEGDSIPAATRSAWFTSWNLGALLDPLCGACRSDVSQLLVSLAARYPNDRIALISSLQDQTIRSYFQLSAAGFQTALLQLGTDVFDPRPRLHYFFVPGQRHVLLANPAGTQQSGVALLDWLRQELNNDPGWSSVKP